MFSGYILHHRLMRLRFLFLGWIVRPPMPFWGSRLRQRFPTRVFVRCCSGVLCFPFRALVCRFLPPPSPSLLSFMLFVYVQVSSGTACAPSCRSVSGGISQDFVNLEDGIITDATNICQSVFCCWNSNIRY